MSTKQEDATFKPWSFSSNFDFSCEDGQVFFFFLIGIHSMQSWTASARYAALDSQKMHTFSFLFKKLVYKKLEAGAL